MVVQSLSTAAIPKSLPVLSAETVLRKAAFDREIRFSTKHYGCRQRNDFVKCAVSVFFGVYFYIIWFKTVSEIVCYCCTCFGSLANSLF